MNHLFEVHQTGLKILLIDRDIKDTLDWPLKYLVMAGGFVLGPSKFSQTGMVRQTEGLGHCIPNQLHFTFDDNFISP